MQLTIRRKILAIALAALGFLVLVGLTGYGAAVVLSASADGIHRDATALKEHLEAAQGLHALRADTLAIVLAGRTGEGQEQAIRSEMARHERALREALEDLQGKRLPQATAAALARVRPAVDRFVQAAQTVAGMAFSENEGAMARLPDFERAFRALDKEMEGVAGMLQANSSAILAEGAQASGRARAAIVAALLASAAFLCAVSWVIGRNIAARIAQAVDIAQTVAGGDLGSRIEVRGSDEAAQLLAALARMNQGLVQLVGTVRAASESIASGAAQIAGGNQDLSSRTELQAGNLQQTAASVEQISATVRVNADTTRRASEMAAAATTSAVRSGEDVRRLQDTMQEITEASRRVGDIIGVIDGIAFQTNILALNASVEAARAGEQGRGFAVVAAEVRALAQRSATAAREVKGLVEGSVARVSTGGEQASAASQSMAEVVRQVQEVTTLVAEISGATAEQSRGIAEVSQAVTQIDRATQSNASLVEEAAAAAESLNRQAARLVEAVSAFRVEQQPRLGAA